MKNEEANQAAWEASKGGLAGAAKMGVVTALAGAVGFAMSPLYRGTTIQFKV
jgi:predicted lipid-binding transport protein (Tim44 family)